MARLNTITASSPAVTHSSSPRTSAQSVQTDLTSPLSDDDDIHNSDKENEDSGQRRTSLGKRKNRTATMSMQERETNKNSSNKRRRTAKDPVAQKQSQVALRKQLDSEVDTKYYDPDQAPEQKRAVQKRLRDLLSSFNDSRSEFLQASSKGIEATLQQADAIYDDVKQTSVATIDSRLLVTVGDLAYKKVNTLTLGDSSTGVDVDDFVTKCIAFMKRGDTLAAEDSRSGRPPASQGRPSTQRRRAHHQAGEDSDDDEDTEPLNWSYLARSACTLYNARPSLPGFLLGPLSVQKKVRQQSQRRVARERPGSPSRAARPTTLGAEDLEKQESTNLTVICSEIARLLQRTMRQGEKKVQEEYEEMALEYPDDEGPPEAQVRALMAKHGISDNGCVPLFNFCVNPNSFGQTVENMFYVSFLIKEGKVGMDFDSNGLPTLGDVEQKSVEERQGTQRNQAVFTLDFDIWKDIVESFGIERSIIPHREEERWDDGTLASMAQEEDTTPSDDRSNIAVRRRDDVEYEDLYD